VGFEDGWDARVVRTLRDLRSRTRAGARPPEVIVEPGAVLHELRLVKGPEELQLLRKAAEITAEGHLAAMRDGQAGRREHQVQAEIEYAFRRRGGNGPGYGTIVAAGPNSCILHYRAGDAVLEDGQVCLVDAGGEYQWYTADVTRTFPVSGSFTRPQRDIYEVVLEAQKVGIEAVRPGATVDGIHDLVVRRLTEGMIKLGLLQGEVEERIADKSFRKYYMHRTSHWLGLDVHDVGDYTPGRQPRPLAPGMVITVEPGLYVAADDQAAPAELRGVGVRIEDDVLVTEGGYDNLTAAVPKEVGEVEACCTR
jgi:Xaa-Pro aminopeptidase